MKILDGSLKKLEAMEASFAEILTYPTLSSASAAFSASDITASSN
jgi:hypothetical protein